MFEALFMQRGAAQRDAAQMIKGSDRDADDDELGESGQRHSFHSQANVVAALRAVPLSSSFAPAASPPGSVGSGFVQTLQMHASSLPVALGYVLCSSLLMVLNKLALQVACSAPPAVAKPALPPPRSSSPRGSALTVSA